MLAHCEVKNYYVSVVLFANKSQTPTNISGLYYLFLPHR